MTRLYKNFTEAFNEIGRDLAEMGIKVHPKTWQDQDVSNNPDFETKELQNYTYTVINPDSKELSSRISWPYCQIEWQERQKGALGKPCNPGTSWESRREVWEEFLQDDGTFAYAYPERFAQNGQVMRVIERLKIDPDSRQCFISVWNSTDITKMGGISRIPCTLGYLVQCKREKIDITYLQRSADFATHLHNDVYFASKMQEFIATEVSREVGKFTHWFGSLHVFQRDVKDIF